LSRHQKSTTIPAVFGHFAKLNWPVAAQRRQISAWNRKPPKLTLAVAGSTLAVAAAAGAFWPTVATAQPARPTRITSTSAKTATTATAAAAASQTSAQIAARFEAVGRLGAVRTEVAQARRAELLAARRLASRKAAARRQAATAATSGASSINAPSATAVPAQPAVGSTGTGSPQQIAMAMLGSFGWPSGQFSCLDALWSRESGWNPQASNAGSGAYGIPQALPGNKMASAGADWQTNPATQIRWGLGYIQATYGSPCGAWGHEQGYGWY
jgi:Transglycosylase SLT domain